MKIDQKKFSTRHTFTFGPDMLNFGYVDKSGSGDVDIPYADIPAKSSIQIEKNLWLRNVGYLWCLLGGLQIAWALISGKSLAGTGFWLMLGLICVLWAHVTTIKYTVFHADQGSIFVIQDGKTHDRITGEMASRKKDQLLALFGNIDIENGLEREVSKFRWLAEQKVLTPEEANQRIAQVEAAFALSHGFGHVCLN